MPTPYHSPKIHQEKLKILALNLKKCTSRIRSSNIKMLERDTIYGKKYNPDEIPKSGKEIEATEAFQRLHHVRQTGFRIGSHSRGEHSHGAAWLAAHLHHGQIGLDREALVAAALSHDIGHYVFSHTSEAALPKDISHKKHGIEIIRTDPELQEIFRRHNIDPEEVIRIAFKKFRGNPFTVRRGVQMSIDHFDNSMNDGKAEPELVAWLVDNLYITDRGVLTFRNEEAAIAQTRLTIKQNCEGIFSKRSILIDHLTLILMQRAVEKGYIDIEDLKGRDDEVITKLIRQQLDSETKWILYQLLNQDAPDSPLAVQNKINELIRHTSADAIGNNRAGTHVIKSHYITPGTVNGIVPRSVQQEIRAASKGILGTFAVDLEKWHRMAKKVPKKLVHTLPAALQAA